MLRKPIQPKITINRKCVSHVEDVSSRTVPPPGVLAQFNSLMKEHEVVVQKNKDLVQQNKELLEQVENLSSQNRGFSTQKKDLISQKKTLSAKNKMFISKMKDLTLKNESFHSVINHFQVLKCHLLLLIASSKQSINGNSRCRRFPHPQTDLYQKELIVYR